MKSLSVIKIGGNIINDHKTLHHFLAELSQLKGPKILVHGGGKSATQLATQMQVPVQMIDGRRITDTATLDIITMVYAGKLNKHIVTQLQAEGTNALGLSGADGNAIVAEKRAVTLIDYGYVGDIIQVNATFIESLLAQEIIPVFCALTHDGKGQLLNTNADTIAAEIAMSLANTFQTTLYYCFEKKGVLSDIDNNNSVLEKIDTQTYAQLLQDGIISEGMLPKLNNCFHALQHHVHKVCIGHTDMLFTSNSTYTTIQL